MAPSFESIARWRITPDNPPRQWRDSSDNSPREIDGMDSERCAALHNFIVQHAWTSYHGLPIEQFNPRTWWENPTNNAESIRSKIHPSLVDFYQRAYEITGDTYLSFFVYLNCLHPPGDFYFSQHLWEEERTIVLYLSPSELGSHAEGLLYDQEEHTVRMNFSMHDFSISGDGGYTDSWLPLECVLSIYIDMIERGKTVALSKEKIAELKETREIDPATGACGDREIFKPWTMVPYSPLDLEDTIGVWNSHIEDIEKRMPGHVEDEPPQYGLIDAVHLDAAGIPPGFAREFLSRGRKPKFSFIAPGIRVQTVEEFMSQPFLNIVDRWGAGDDYRWPLRLFMIEHANQYSLIEPGYPESEVQSQMPSGLFLNGCSVNRPCPFEDSVALEYPCKFAKELGPWEMEKTHLWGKFHNTQLLAILENMYEALNFGYWQVDEHGVAGGFSVFEEASAEELTERYSIPTGPTLFW